MTGRLGTGSNHGAGARYPALQIDAEFKRQLALYFSISAIFYLLSALVFTGFTHPDQHFQTLEFADFKRKGSNEALLPWEYHYAMRSWLQPYIYYWFLEIMNLLGIEHPFTQDRIIRITTGLLGILALIALCITFARWLPLPGQRKWLVIGFSFLWIFPQFHTRTASETMSAIFLMLAIATLFLLRHDVQEQGDAASGKAKRPGQPFVGPLSFSTEGLVLSAICLGLVFHFRYQLGVVVVAMAAWMFLVARVPIRQMVLFCGAVVVTATLGLVVDILGYGRFEIAPWNYIQANLIDGEASNFGVAPWHFYFSEAMRDPIGLILFLSMISFSIEHPKNLLTWLIAAFFVEHCAVDHKEMRFIFPIIFIALTMLVFLVPAGWYGADGRQNPFWHRSRTLRILFILVATYNCLALVYESVRLPNAVVSVHQFIISYAPDDFEFYSIRHSPFGWDQDHKSKYPVRMEFYAPKKFTHHKLNSIRELLRKAKEEGPIVFLHKANELPDNGLWDPVREACEMIYQSYGPFMQSMNFFEWQSRETRVSIYECEADRPPDDDTS